MSAERQPADAVDMSYRALSARADTCTADSQTEDRQPASSGAIVSTPRRITIDASAGLDHYEAAR